MKWRKIWPSIGLFFLFFPLPILLRVITDSVAGSNPLRMHRHLELRDNTCSQEVIWTCGIHSGLTLILLRTRNDVGSGAVPSPGGVPGPERWPQRYGMLGQSHHYYPEEAADSCVWSRRCYIIDIIEHSHLELKEWARLLGKRRHDCLGSTVLSAPCCKCRIVDSCRVIFRLWRTQSTEGQGEAV